MLSPSAFPVTKSAANCCLKSPGRTLTGAATFPLAGSHSFYFIYFFVITKELRELSHENTKGSCPGVFLRWRSTRSRFTVFRAETWSMDSGGLTQCHVFGLDDRGTLGCERNLDAREPGTVPSDGATFVCLSQSFRQHVLAGGCKQRAKS